MQYIIIACVSVRYKYRENVSWWIEEGSKPWPGCRGCNCDSFNWRSSVHCKCGPRDNPGVFDRSAVATDLPLIKFGRIIFSTTWPWLVAYKHWQKTVSSLSGRFSSMFSSSLTLLFDGECDCINKTTTLSSHRTLILPVIIIELLNRSNKN